MCPPYSMVPDILACNLIYLSINILSMQKAVKELY